MKRLVLSLTALLLMSVSMASSQDAPPDHRKLSQKLKEAELEMQGQLSWLGDYVAVYTAIDDKAAQVENRLPYFNPAEVAPYDPMASADYLMSLPHPLTKPGTRPQLNLGFGGTWPKTTILGGSATLHRFDQYERSYGTLKQSLPGIRQKIGELATRIRTLQTLLGQPGAGTPPPVEILPQPDFSRLPTPETTFGASTEPPPADSVSQPGSTGAGQRVKDAWALVNEGNALYRTNRFDEAYERFDKAVHIDPTVMPAYYGRGCVAAVNQDWESALGDFAMALSLYPTDGDVLYSRGLVFLANGREEEAIRDLQAASRGRHLLSAQVLRRMALHWEEDGFTHYKNDRYVEATDSFERAIKIDPSYPDPYFNNGLMYEKLDHFRPAVYYLNKYLEVLGEYGTGPEKVVCFPLYSVSDEEELPDLELETDDSFSASGEAHFRIGLNFYHLKDLGQAITHYTQAIKYESVGTPGNLGRDYYHRARAYYERDGKGDKKMALNDLRIACRMGDAVSCEMKNELADELNEPR